MPENLKDICSLQCECSLFECFEHTLTVLCGKKKDVTRWYYVSKAKRYGRCVHTAYATPHTFISRLDACIYEI